MLLGKAFDALPKGGAVIVYDAIIDDDRRENAFSLLLPVAGAFCRFNPVYGQGMASAAKQARLLQTVLGQVAAEPDSLAAAHAGFMAEVASMLQTPWSMSTNANLAFPETRGDRPENFEEGQQFEAALFRAAVADPVVHRALI